MTYDGSQLVIVWQKNAKYESSHFAILKFTCQFNTTPDLLFQVQHQYTFCSSLRYL